LRWEDHAIFNNYRKVLTDSARTTWDEVISDQFSDAEDRITANYALARRTFIRKLLVCDRPRDVQLRYLQVGGGAKKDPFMSTEGHMRRWKQVFRNSLKLPKGSMGRPKKNEVLEWYYWTYPKRWRINYLSAPKDLYGDSIEGITEYMRLQEQKDETDGTAARIRLQAAQDRAKRDRIAKERERRDYRSTRCRSASNSPERRRSSKKKARRFSRDERRDDRRSSGGSSYHRYDESRKRYEGKDYYNKDKSDCPVHRPCKHAWEQCSKNPKNAGRNGDDKRKGDGKREHAHVADTDSKADTRSDDSSATSKSNASSADDRSDRSDRSERSVGSDGSGAVSLHAIFDESPEVSATADALAKTSVEETRIPRKQRRSRDDSDDSEDDDSDDAFAADSDNE